MPITTIRPTTDTGSRLRLLVIVAGGLAAPGIVFSVGNASVSSPGDLPSRWHVWVFWAVFYSAGAYFFTWWANIRRTPVGLCFVVFPAMGLATFGRFVPSFALIVLALTGCFIALSIRGGGTTNPTSEGASLRAIFWTCLALAVPIAFLASLTSAREALSRAAPDGYKVLHVAPRPSGDVAAGIIFPKIAWRYPAASPAVITVRRTAGGSWEPLRIPGVDSRTGLPRNSFVRPFADECRSLMYQEPADRFSLCLMTAYPGGGPISSILTGILPSQGRVVDVTLESGKVIRRPAGGGIKRTFVLWGGTVPSTINLDSVVRVAVRDSSGALVDSMVGPSRYGSERETFARMAAGCFTAPRLPCQVDDRFIVSISILTPLEFRELCRREPPRGEWILVGSVFVSEHEAPDYPRRYSEDRRLIGANIARVAWGIGRGSIPPISLPRSDRPCFPRSIDED